MEQARQHPPSAKDSIAKRGRPLVLQRGRGANSPDRRSVVRLASGRGEGPREAAGKSSGGKEGTGSKQERETAGEGERECSSSLTRHAEGAFQSRDKRGRMEKTGGGG